MPSLKTAGTEGTRFRPFGPSIDVLFPKMNIPDDLRGDLVFLFEIRTSADFLKLVSKKYRTSSTPYKLISKALEICEKWHGPRIRHSGESEFDHCLRCAAILWMYQNVRNANRIAAMILHDLSETFRAAWPISRIAREFNGTVAEYVRRLTKPLKRSGLSKAHVEHMYYLDLRDAPSETIEQKAVDLLDNLLTLWKRGADRMRNKIRDVRKYFLPLLSKFPGLVRLYRTLQSVLDVILRKVNDGTAFVF